MQEMTRAGRERFRDAHVCLARLMLVGGVMNLSRSDHISGVVLLTGGSNYSNAMMQPAPIPWFRPG